MPQAALGQLQQYGDYVEGNGISFNAASGTRAVATEYRWEKAEKPKEVSMPQAALGQLQRGIMLLGVFHE